MMTSLHAIDVVIALESGVFSESLAEGEISHRFDPGLQVRPTAFDIRGPLREGSTS